MLTCSIDWIIRSQIPEVLRIDKASFEFNWTEEDFMNCLRQRNCMGLSAISEGQVAGFIIYELHKTRFIVLNIAVDPVFRGHHFGISMIEKLKNKLSQMRRDSISLHIRETNLDGQLFFRSQGFKAVRVSRGHFSDYTPEDAYEMRFCLSDQERHNAIAVDRISNY